MFCCVFFVFLLGSAQSQQSGPSVRGFCSSKGGELEVIMRPRTETIVKVGDTVSIACAGHGHGMADPHVFWIRGFGKNARQLGPIATGKSVLYFNRVSEDDLGRYRCVIKDCCSWKKEEIDIDIKVDDETCEDVYGVGPVLYGAVWQYRNWTDAVRSCESKGLAIAFPRDEVENAEMLENIKASFKTHPNSRQFHHDNWVWIGASDANEEGNWIETTTGKSVTWTNWMKGQPDNWTKLGSKYLHGQDCVGMSRKTGVWDDSFIHHQRPYVCRCKPREEEAEDMIHMDTVGL